MSLKLDRAEGNGARPIALAVDDPFYLFGEPSEVPPEHAVKSDRVTDPPEGDLSKTGLGARGIAGNGLVFSCRPTVVGQSTSAALAVSVWSDACSTWGYVVRSIRGTGRLMSSPARS